MQYGDGVMTTDITETLTTNNGFLQVDNNAEAYFGPLENGSTGTLVVDQAFMQVGDEQTGADLQNDSGGQVRIQNGAELDLYGQFTNNGNTQVNGQSFLGVNSFVNGSGATLELAGHSPDDNSYTQMQAVGWQDGPSFQNDSSGDVHLSDGAYLQVNGQFINNGSTRLDSGAGMWADDFVNGSGATLTLGGNTTWSDGVYPTEMSVTDLHNDAGGSIHVQDGARLDIYGQFMNDGIARIDGDSTVIVGESGSVSPDLLLPADLSLGVQNGAGATMVVEAGSRLDASGLLFDNWGAVSLDGELDVAQLAIHDGLLVGSGVVEGNVTQDGGVLNPGDSAVFQIGMIQADTQELNTPGTFTIDGDYVLDGGTLEIDFSDLTGPGTGWGWLNVLGSADLSGYLNLVFSDALTLTAVSSSRSWATPVF